MESKDFEKSNIEEEDLLEKVIKSRVNQSLQWLR